MDRLENRCRRMEFSVDIMLIVGGSYITYLLDAGMSKSPAYTMGGPRFLFAEVLTLVS